MKILRVVMLVAIALILWPTLTTEATAKSGKVGGHSCEDQKKWGKCGEPWMSPTCDEVCEDDSIGNSQKDSVKDKPGMVGGYSCEDQKKWGKCGEPWMSPACDRVCKSKKGKRTKNKKKRRQ